MVAGWPLLPQYAASKTRRTTASRGTLRNGQEPPPAPRSRFAEYRERHPLLERGRTSDSVANILRDAILDGVLEPGTWLREAELARELHVSRTPIRDAFRTLAAEGFLSINANQGALVTAMTSADVVELYTMRETLEGLAAKLAARRASKQCRHEFEVLLPQMKQAAEANLHQELARLNLEFHHVIRGAAGNRYLGRFLAHTEHVLQRFRHTTTELPGRLNESLDEHVRLAEAISAGDSATAERVATEHMRRLAELRIRMLLEGF